MQASLCSGEWLICAMSTMVVVPMSIMSERGDQLADVNVGRRIGQRQIVLDVAVVVGIDEAVRQRASEQALIGVDMRVHKTRNDDPVDAIDNDRPGRRRDVLPDRR